MNDPESAFLGRVRKALGKHTPMGPMTPEPEDTAPEKARITLDRIANREKKDQRELLERLVEEGRSINLQVHPVRGFGEAAETIREIAVENRPRPTSGRGILCWRHPLIDRLDLMKAFADQDIPFFPADLRDPALADLPEDERRDRIRGVLDQAFMGITSADFCVAYSATLVLRSRAGQPRAVSLAPDVHVAIIELGQILADFDELYTILEWHPEIRREGLGPNLTFITGPSKTADIELHIVYGVHGPRKVHLLVLTETDPPRNLTETSEPPVRDAT